MWHIPVTYIAFDHGNVTLHLLLQVYRASFWFISWRSSRTAFMHLCSLVCSLRSTLLGQLGAVGGCAVGLERFSKVCVLYLPFMAFVRSSTKTITSLEAFIGN